MTGGGGLIVSVRVLIPVPPALVAFKDMLKVPEEVGIPEIKPLAVLTVSPAGRPVASKLVGLLVAVI